MTETGGTSAGHRDADRDRRGQGRRTGNGQSSPPRSYGHNYPYYYGDYYGYGHSYGYGGYYGYPYGYGRYSSFRLHHYPYPYYYPFGWGAYGVDARRARNAYRTGALDTDLRPEKAEIYIDGRYVGVADQFDGFPDYLWLEEGDYDVAIYADGFETISRQVRVRQGMILQLKDRMARGESIRPEQVSPLTHTPPPADELAALRLFVAPGDAAVYLDGRLVGRADEIERLDELVAGEHLLEVVRPGHRSRELAFSIESGEEAELAIELEEAAAPEGEGSETGK